MAIPSAQLPMGVSTTPLNITRYTLASNHRLADVSTSGNAGGAIHAPVIRDAQWSAELPIDDATTIEALLGGGSGYVIADLRFYTAAARYDKLVNTTIASITKSTDATSDVPRIAVSGQGGVLTTNN